MSRVLKLVNELSFKSLFYVKVLVIGTKSRLEKIINHLLRAPSRDKDLRIAGKSYRLE